MQIRKQQASKRSVCFSTIEWKLRVERILASTVGIVRIHLDDSMLYALWYENENEHITTKSFPPPYMRNVMASSVRATYLRYAAKNFTRTKQTNTPFMRETLQIETICKNQIHFVFIEKKMFRLFVKCIIWTILCIVMLK